MQFLRLGLSVRAFAALVGWAAVALVIFATLSPIGARPHIAHVGPQVERFAAYLIAAAALALAYPQRRGLILSGIVAGAAGLEIAQYFEASRHARALDAAVKIAGGMAGMASVALCEWFWSWRDAQIAVARRSE
jgi:hypothetical protein